MDAQSRSYDYVIVGGGSAGAPLAARLAADPSARVALVEAGPEDTQERVLDVTRWWDLLGSDLDFDYGIEPQARGNASIRHSRARVLGGCSSHNSCIAFTAPDRDLREWVALGASGWGPDDCAPFFDRVRGQVHTGPPNPNPFTDALLAACEQAGLPTVAFEAWDYKPAAGRFNLNVKGGIRQSSSVSYLHPLGELPSNLQLLVDTPVQHLLLDREGAATGVATAEGDLHAERAVVLSSGAIDTPRLLMLSGIGPADHLRSVGIDPVLDLPGVGAHLLDHPEGVVNYASRRALPPTLQQWEIGVFAATGRATEPDVMLHVGSEVFDLHTAPQGYPSAEHGFAFTPNVCKARSEGTVRLRSADPHTKPSIDFAYFTDPAGYDERVMTDGVELAREIAAQAPLAEWVDRELSPGAPVTDRTAVSEYVRRTANTVYHPTGTAKMGAPGDPTAVVDPELRVRGVERLRIADASVFPSMTSVNPNLTCMMIGERAAAFLRAAAR